MGIECFSFSHLVCPPRCRWFNWLARCSTGHIEGDHSEYNPNKNKTYIEESDRQAARNQPHGKQSEELQRQCFDTSQSQSDVCAVYLIRLEMIALPY
jgi:hypothetical protein